MIVKNLSNYYSKFTLMIVVTSNSYNTSMRFVAELQMRYLRPNYLQIRYKSNGYVTTALYYGVWVD